MHHNHAAAGTAAALRARAPTSDAVALQARRAAEHEPPSPVVSLTARRPGALTGRAIRAR
ncbi:hypothetical protein [Streptacidiphilus alkalitolerans]|uniref:hypothetical protein n=1 Tax=Streptacidiphilus alkalitolerans TaxID=3342712 RepID=UPI0036D308D4